MQCSIENGADCVFSRAVICFFTNQNKSAVAIHREICSHHLYRHTVTVHRTHFPMNFNSWFVLGGKKWITACTLQSTTTCNGSSIFNTAFCTFLWSNCYIIFTVLSETQKLYRLAISHWSVYKILRKKNWETYFVSWNRFTINAHCSSSKTIFATCNTSVIHNSTTNNRNQMKQTWCWSVLPLMYFKSLAILSLIFRKFENPSEVTFETSTGNFGFVENILHFRN